jgi:hypothetical protein
MTLKELKLFIRQGKWGIVPKWKGYIKWNYATNEMQFVNGDYVMTQKELEDKTKNRLDLYYII